MSLGAVISTRRRAMHLTQEQLAEKINVSKSAVAKWETDGGLPDRDNLLKLSEIMRISIDELYRIIDGKEEYGLKVYENILEEIILVLESYGYKIISPVKEEMEDI